MMKFSENLKNELFSRNLTQEKLAKKLGTTQATVSRWIKGVNQPDFETLFVICQFLELSPNDLLGWDE